MLYSILINYDGIMLTAKVPNVPNTLFYGFFEDEIKRDLFLKVVGISVTLEKEGWVQFDNFEMEENTKEILDFFAITNLTEEEKLKPLVEQYLNEDMSREQFEHEIIPYRVAEKLSK